MHTYIYTDDTYCRISCHCLNPPFLNPQVADGVYKPHLVYCRMGFRNTSPFPALHLSRNVAKMSESLKISDQRMAKLY